MRHGLDQLSLTIDNDFNTCVVMMVVTILLKVHIPLIMIIADDDDDDDGNVDDQPEPINIGVSLAFVLISKGVQGGDIHTRHL